MSSGKKLIIIGGGVSGLVTGIYAQKAGFEAVIFEKNKIAGGACTGWDRDGFHIDGCIHWLAGTAEGRELNRLWKDTGALEGVEIYQPESLTTVMDDNGTLSIWRDSDKLKKHLLEVSPDDKASIEELMDSVEAFMTFEPSVDKPVDEMNIFEKLRFLLKNRSVFGKIRKYSQQSINEYKQRFKNPLIRAALGQIVPEKYSAHTLFFTLAAFLSNNAGVPKGGSRAFAGRLENKFRSLGGMLFTGTEAEEIIIEGETATGVKLKSGIRDFADYIITACDPDLVFNGLLKGGFRDWQFQYRYEDSEAYPLHTRVYFYFSVDSDLSSYPGNSAFKISGLKFENRTIEKLSMRHYCHEPSFSPKGKSLISVYADAGYDWWKSLHEDRDAYNLEKARLTHEISRHIELRFPELSGKLDIIDVITPLTYERNFGAYKGSWLSFGNTPESQPLRHTGKADGIKNLYMTGQWFMPPGGLPAAAITGRWTIQRLCRENRIRFSPEQQAF